MPNNQPVIYNANLNRYEEGEVIGEQDYGSGDNIADFHNFAPRLSVAYVINDKSSVKASYNRTYQYLHLVSNTAAPTPLDVWTPSGKFIKPAQADQYALGYFRNFKENTYEVSVEGYYKNMDNVLDFIDGADLLGNNYLETQVLQGEGRAYGLEFLAKKSKGKLTGWFSYTWSRAERRIQGVGQGDRGINNGEYYAANYDKRHDLSVTGAYQYSKKWTFAANFVYASGIPTTYPQSQYDFGGLSVAHFDDRNSERMPCLSSIRHFCHVARR